MGSTFDCCNLLVVVLKANARENRETNIHTINGLSNINQQNAGDTRR